MSRQTASPAMSTTAPESGTANPVTITASPHQSVDSEEVARLAYTHWQIRGCPDGSPEDDWLRAEQDLNGRPE